MALQSIEHNLGWDQDVLSHRTQGARWSLERIVFVGAVGAGYLVCALALAYPIYMHMFVYSVR
jgi:hypothetical protein